MKEPSLGVLVVSVDVERDTLRYRLGLPTTRWQDTAGGRIAALLAEFELPATWALPDPAVSIAAEPLLNAEVGQEIAVLAEQAWAGPGSGRAVFHRELSRRVLGAQAAGIEITSLLFRSGHVPDHWDLIAKQGILTVRGAEDGRGLAAQLAVPRVQRFGIWELPGSIRVPAGGSWLVSLGSGRRACRHIDRAINAGAVFHLVLDGSLLDYAGPAGERAIRRVLRHAARRWTDGVLTVATMRDAAARLAGKHQASPSFSILRPRAA